MYRLDIRDWDYTKIIDETFDTYEAAKARLDGFFLEDKRYLLYKDGEIIAKKW